MRFFYSVSRRSLLEFSGSGVLGLKERIEKINRRAGFKIVGGIDLTGSMLEAFTRETTSVEQIVERLKILFQTAQDLSVPLRIHAFEGSNSGRFYEALKLALSDTPCAFELIVGHIAQLNEDWFQFFKALPGRIKVSFDACVAAEVLLHEVSLEQVARNVFRSVELGFPTLYGPDGYGMIEKATYVEQADSVVEELVRLKVIKEIPCGSSVANQTGKDVGGRPAPANLVPAARP